MASSLEMPFPGMSTKSYPFYSVLIFTYASAWSVYVISGMECASQQRGNSPFSSAPVLVPLTQLGVPGVHLGFRRFGPKPCDSSLGLWKRCVQGRGWFHSRVLSAPFEHIRFQCSLPGHNLEVKISQKSSKELCWDSFIASRQSAVFG